VYVHLFTTEKPQPINHESNVILNQISKTYEPNRIGQAFRQKYGKHDEEQEHLHAGHLLGEFPVLLPANPSFLQY
jgi:hypothetical protein